jgi:hypothetical protein
LDEITAMNEPSELWNLPWQELQRSLAAGFGAGGYAAGNSQASFQSAGARGAAAPVASWLVRAAAAPTRYNNRPQNNCRITDR